MFVLWFAVLGLWVLLVVCVFVGWCLVVAEVCCFSGLFVAVDDLIFLRF